MARPAQLDGGGTTDRRHGGTAVRRRARSAFTILELQVSLIVLTAGLFTMSSLVSVQSKQMSRLETWCRPDPTYYVVSQSNRWLRKLNAQAQLETQAGQAAWTPPVAGNAKHQVVLESWEWDVDGRTASASVRLGGIED